MNETKSNKNAARDAEQDHARQQALAQLESIKEMLTKFNEGVNDDEIEEARESIQQDPLSVEVRSGWQSVGEALEASEFCILLLHGWPCGSYHWRT